MPDASNAGGAGSNPDGTNGGAGAAGDDAVADDRVTYVKASNTDASDLFGVSVAFSADGATLAVGANREASAATGVDGDADDDSAMDAGALYLFALSQGSWQQSAYLKASNAGAGDGFGSCAALAADGNTLAVGAPFEASAAMGVDGDGADDSMVEAGAVYVFVRDGVGWRQQAYLKDSNTHERALFGFSLALSADGDTLAVGANGEDSSATGVDGDQSNRSSYEAGAVFVFSRSQDVWEQTAYLKASNTDAGDHFGDAVALSADGRTLAAGASFEDGGSAGVDGDPSNDAVPGVGAVYVFTNDGSSWLQQAYLKPAEIDGYGYDNFGISLSLSSDGNTLAVGAAGDNSGKTGVGADATDVGKPYAGAAYVFRRESGSWVQDVYIKAANADVGDEFGHHLSLSADGTTLAVGAALEASAGTGERADPSDNSAAGAGAVYLFRSAGETWQQWAFLKATNPDAGDHFGWAVALSADASSLAVGASRESSAVIGIGGDEADDSAARAGATYVFELTNVAP